MVMLTRVSWVVLVILATITGSGSEEVVAKEGDTLFLPCRGETGDTCIWTRSFPDGTSSVVAISKGVVTTPRYLLNDQPQLGDCSLNITAVESGDIAKLTCGIKPKNDLVITYSVMVGVQPQDPLIEYKNQNVNDGDIVIIETPAEIKCIVNGGKPTPKVTWITEYNYFSNGTTVDNGDTVDVTQTLKIDNFLQERKPEIAITCTAVHQLYPYVDHQKSITITVGEEYATTSVRVEQNKTYASCVADGIPRPHFQWQFRKTNADQWEDTVTTQNTTLENNGDYRCQAGNDVGGSPRIASDIFTKTGDGEVNQHPNDEDNSKQAGVIAGVVVAVLVVLCIIGGLTLFTYRRKSLCFKERRPIPSNNPGNVENGGKIQTINDEKEKGEIKGDQNDNTKQKEIVYAQLDLPLSQGHNVNTPKSEEKTEYAQIKFQPKENQV